MTSAATALAARTLQNETDIEVLTALRLAMAAAAVTDHGALTGLADDDHPQYHNDARGDARYDPMGAAAAAAAASQPLDSDLTAIAALSTTAFGRALLTLADAAAFTATANVATAALKGLAPASGGGVVNFLRADLTWAAPPGGGGGGNLDDILALEVLL